MTADEKHLGRLSNKLNLDPQRGLKRKAWRLVALRFEVLKSDAAGDARVDDVLVDPKMRFYAGRRSSSRASWASSSSS